MSPWARAGGLGKNGVPGALLRPLDNLHRQPLPQRLRHEVKRLECLVVVGVEATVAAREYADDQVPVEPGAIDPPSLLVPL